MYDLFPSFALISFLKDPRQKAYIFYRLLIKVQFSWRVVAALEPEVEAS
jgi:hypothetical protein